jgi:hypothetical protein
MVALVGNLANPSFNSSSGCGRKELLTRVRSALIFSLGFHHQSQTVCYANLRHPFQFFLRLADVAHVDPLVAGPKLPIVYRWERPNKSFQRLTKFGPD